MFAVAAIAIGLVASFVVAEIALRVYVTSRGWTPNCYVTGLAFFVPHEQAGHTLRPNLRMRSFAYDVTTNSFGLRGPEIEPRKPDDTSRIMVLGGSSVFGYLVPDEQDSCAELQAILEQDQSLADQSWEVLNAGVPGYNLMQSRLRYTSDLAALQPDWVILYLGWNDSTTIISPHPESIDRTPPAPPWWQRVMIHSVVYGLVTHRLLPKHAPKFAPPEDASIQVTGAGMKRFRDDYQALIDAVQASGAKVIISTQMMAGSPQCERLDRYLGSTPQQIQTNRQIARSITETVRELATVNHLPLVDIAADVPCDETLLGDAIHLTRQGHRLVAAAWAEHWSR